MHEILNLPDGIIKIEFSQAERERSRYEEARDFQETVKPMFERWRRETAIRLHRPGNL